MDGQELIKAIEALLSEYESDCFSRVGCRLEFVDDSLLPIYNWNGEKLSDEVM